MLLHEIGHVEHRHSLRMLLSHAGLVTLAGLVFGDLSGLGSVLLALPGVLMEQSYSRDLEREADGYALAHLAAAGVDGADFVALLERLERCADLTPDDDTDFVARCRARLSSPAPRKDTAVAGAAGWRPYLATHPATAERLARFARAGSSVRAHQDRDRR